MPRVRSISVVAIALLLAACGTGTTGPKALNGVLLRAADLPDMRLYSESPVLQAFPFQEAVGHGILFKDPIPKVVAQLKSYGFVRAYAERFNGPGTIAAAFVAQFASGKDLSGMLTYMNTNLFEICPSDPTCSIKTVLKVPAIPGAYGQLVHPARSSDEGKDITLYKVIFTVGSEIFGVEIGGDNVYDPGTVSQSEALAAFKAFYNEVKAEIADQIFNAVPKTPLGPPPPGGGIPASAPPGEVPTGSPS